MSRLLRTTVARSKCTRCGKLLPQWVRDWCWEQVLLLPGGHRPGLLCLACARERAIRYLNAGIPYSWKHFRVMDEDG